jgi:hypothetical protein
MKGNNTKKLAVFVIIAAIAMFVAVTVASANDVPTCTYTLSVSNDPPSWGTVTISPKKSTYCAGDQVTLTATPSSGYGLFSWSEVDSSEGPTAHVTMNGNRKVTARWKRAIY